MGIHRGPKNFWDVGAQPFRRGVADPKTRSSHTFVIIPTFGRSPSNCYYVGRGFKKFGDAVPLKMGTWLTH